SDIRPRAELRLQTTATVLAPFLLACSTAATVYGVRPLAANPTTTSFFPGFRRAMSRRPVARESSLYSAARPRALGPPAITYWMVFGSVPNVGGHSEASSAASRPLVPAPT